MSESRYSSRTDPTLPASQVEKWDQSSRNMAVRQQGGRLGQIAGMAGSLDGVVARRDILAAGVDPSVIDNHLARGNLRSVYRGIYSVGHVALSPLGRWRAALLLAGKGACLSHTSAAQIHRLIDDSRFASQGIIHVARRHGGKSGIRPALASRQPPVRIHRIKGLQADDICRRRGLALTSVDRTLIDLAAMLSSRQLESVVLRAQRLDLLDPSCLAARLKGTLFGQEGIATLRELIDGATPDKAKTLSDPEAWMLDLFHHHGLPRPLVNELVEGLKVDFYWPKARLIVELDGHAFHSSRQAQQRDRRRDRTLQLAGYRVLRYTYDDLITAPGQVVAEIADALRRA